MAKATSIANKAAISLLDDFQATQIDGGTANPEAHIKVYDGIPPTRVDDALSSNNIAFDFLLTTPPSFEAAVDNPGSTRADMDIDTTWRTGGDANSNIATKINGTSTVTFFRIHDRDDVGIIQGTVDTVSSGLGDMLIAGADLSFDAGEQLRIDTHQIRLPEGP